jgi:hypothetical protein
MSPPKWESLESTPPRPSIVDILLENANGLNGKMNRLLIPILETDAPNLKQAKKAQRKLNKAEEKLRAIHQLNAIGADVNRDRNGVVHQGQFRGEKQAKATIALARKFIEGLVSLYEPQFELADETRAESET